MNNKIAIGRLADLLAHASGYDREMCEFFLRELFTLVTERLADDDNVKIKGLGTFKATKVEERRSVDVNTGEEIIIPSHRKVSFTPDKALAEAVNEPFAMFESVELNDSVTDKMLESATSEAEAETNTDMVSETTVESAAIVPESSDTSVQKEEEKEEPEPEPEPQIQSESESEPESASEPESVSAPEPEKEPEPTIQSEPESTPEPIPVQRPARRASLRRGILIGIAGTIVVLVGVAALWRLIAPESFCMMTGTRMADETYEIAQPAQATYSDARKAGQHVMSAADTEPEVLPAHITEADRPGNENKTSVTQTKNTDEVPTAPSDRQRMAETKAETKAAETDKSDTRQKPAKKQYDVITKKRFLTTMAREYYGDYNLWPFIYDENKAILGHPDRIKPGTRIVIPPASKYGIDASDPACVARAKRRGAQIYAKYK